VSRDTKELLLTVAFVIAMSVFIASCIVALVKLAREKPKLLRATPLITATDIAPEDR